jgi:hypothetical protein
LIGIHIPASFIQQIADGGRTGLKVPSVSLVNALAFEKSAGTNNDATKKVRSFLIMTCS